MNGAQFNHTIPNVVLTTLQKGQIDTLSIFNYRSNMAVKYKDGV